MHPLGSEILCVSVTLPGFIYVWSFLQHTFEFYCYLKGWILVKKQTKKKHSAYASQTAGVFSPQTVENMAVRENSQHDVLSGGVVDEGSLRVHKKHIRDPDLFHQASVESHAFVCGAGKGQTLVLPVVSEV